ALTKRVYERALEGEMTHHLGYPPKAREGRNSGNSRNGKTSKTVKTGAEDVNLSIPRDRNGEFEPHLVKKHQRRLPGFDAKVLALYARGLTTRDIQGHLEEMYDSDVSPALISAVTDAVLEEVTAWQSRPLEAVYPIVYLDAIHLKMRHSGQVKNQDVYLALGINPEGYKELLGLWIGEHEGAKFWLNVLTQLKNRGVHDILIACVDGLTGFPDAIETAYPKAQVQLCLVHMVRNSLKYVSLERAQGGGVSFDALSRLKTIDPCRRAC
ncbi:MAG: IS256 family transposase, partial [Candidatus Zixiibacteriota bacterium]